jgi:UDP-glucose 4-epimerase
MKVLLTGGNGFIGSWTAQRLYERGHEVVIFDRHFKHKHPIPTENYLGDITDPNAITEAMAHCEGFIHLAGVLGTAETIKNPRPAAWTNIQGGLNVLEAASQYDIPGVNIAVGNYWMNNTYSITKSTVERFAQMFRDERGLRVTNLRALNAYGPGQSVAAPYGDSKVRKIMPAFVCRALSGKDIEVYGDGEQIMDMIHVSDVAEALVRSLEYTAKNGPVEHVIQAGSGNPTTVNDIARAVQREACSRSGRKVNIVHLPMRAGEPEKSIVLGEPKTMDILNMPKLITLEDGLVGAVEYFAEHLASR